MNLIHAVSHQPACPQCYGAFSIHNAVNTLDAPALELLLDRSPLPVVVSFSSPSHLGSRAFDPIYEKAAKALADQVVFVRVDLERNPSCKVKHGVKSIPTLALFSGKMERARRDGNLLLSALFSWMRTNLDLAA